VRLCSRKEISFTKKQGEVIFLKTRIFYTPPVRFIDPDGREPWDNKNIRQAKSYEDRYQGLVSVEYDKGKYGVNARVVSVIDGKKSTIMSYDATPQNQKSKVSNVIESVLEWEGGRDNPAGATIGIPKSDVKAVANGLEVISNVSDAAAVGSVATGVGASVAPYLFVVGKVTGLASDAINVGIDLNEGNTKDAKIGFGGMVVGEIVPRFLMTGNKSMDKVVGVGVDKVIDRKVNELKNK